MTEYPHECSKCASIYRDEEMRDGHESREHGMVSVDV